MLAFGTDGVRGPESEFTASWVRALGAAAAAVLGPATFVVGRDTRASGARIAADLSAGLACAGATVHDLGVAPTPAVAWIAARDGVPAAVVSASHNPYDDNGVKFFAAGGGKLDDATEQRLSAALADALADPSVGGESGGAPGSGEVAGDLSWRADALAAYRDHLVGSLGGRTLGGLRVVLDCANGAASELAADVFTSAGAGVTVVHADPDGTNINAGCGSTHLDVVAAAVVANGADVGLAFDGDADRVLAVDATGAVVDGDQIIAMLALDRHRRGVLAGDAVVVTVMANLGLRLAMESAGIAVVETPVGDRHCLAELERRGLVLGGEQSGHIILADVATTGDGMLSGLAVVDLMARTGTALADLARSAMTRLPQVLRNVVVHADRGAVMAAVAADIDAQQARLGSTGRVLVRPSGTEPLVRVMVEAPDVAVADEVATELVGAITAAAGGVR